MNLGEIEAALYDRLGYQSSPPTEIVRRLRGFVNETHREIIGKKWCSQFRRALVTFSSVANSPFAVLPTVASRIIVLSDRVNGYPLDELTLEDIRYNDAGLQSTTSYPNAYVLLNYAAAVALDPSNASELFLKSDDAGDVQTAYIEGTITGGYRRTASVVLTGSTAVSLSAAITNWIAVTKFYLSSAAVGNVKLFEDSGTGTELARITTGRTYAKYTRIHFYPTPTGANTYYADIDRLVLDMANTYDEPLHHEDWHWLIVCGSLMKEYTKREKLDLVAGEKARWKEGIAEMQLYVSQKGGAAHGPNREPRHFSQLGPMFRSGS